MNKLFGQNATVIPPWQIRKLLVHNPNYGTAYDKGYQEGYSKSFAEGFKIGFEEGRKHYHDKFIQAMKEQGLSEETITTILRTTQAITAST